MGAAPNECPFAGAILVAMPLGHLGVNVPDLGRAKKYYDTLMPLLGYETFLDRPDEFAYRPAEGKVGTYIFFYPSLDSGEYSRHRTGLQHLAFMVKSRDVVQEVHRLVVALGGEVVHEPREFPRVSPRLLRHLLARSSRTDDRSCVPQDDDGRGIAAFRRHRETPPPHLHVGSHTRFGQRA